MFNIFTDGKNLHISKKLSQFCTNILHSDAALVITRKIIKRV